LAGNERRDPLGNLNGSKVAALCREKNGKRKRPRRFLCNPAIRAQEALEILTAFEVEPRKNDFSSGGPDGYKRKS